MSFSYYLIVIFYHVSANCKINWDRADSAAAKAGKVPAFPLKQQF